MAIGSGTGITPLGGGPGSDTTAIHDDVAGEIAAVAEKVSPAGADVVLIEDSAAGNAKKRVSMTNLPLTGVAGTDVNAIHVSTASEISGITEKTNPVAADLLVIEDSAAGNAKKRITIGNIPIATSIAEATGEITTSSVTDVLATTMTLTPGAGTYIVRFSGSFALDNNNRSTFATIYANGVLVAASERERFGLNADSFVPFACDARVTVAAGQAIEGRWRVDDAGDVGTMRERTLVLEKVD